jgi:hypothetical protein
VTATNSLNGSAKNTGDVADGLMIALNLQKPLVSDLHGQSAQIVLTLKNDLCIEKCKHFQMI